MNNQVLDDPILDTFNAAQRVPGFKPPPQVSTFDAAALERLTSLPIWDIAVQTEGKACLRMAAHASIVEDREIRDALALNAWQERRHKEVLSRMARAYGIELASEAPYAYPNDAEWPNL